MNTEKIEKVADSISEAVTDVKICQSELKLNKQELINASEIAINTGQSVDKIQANRKYLIRKYDARLKRAKAEMIKRIGLLIDAVQ